MEQQMKQMTNCGTVSGITRFLSLSAPKLLATFASSKEFDSDLNENDRWGWRNNNCVPWGTHFFQTHTRMRICVRTFINL